MWYRDPTSTRINEFSFHSLQQINSLCSRTATFNSTFEIDNGISPFDLWSSVKGMKIEGKTLLSYSNSSMAAVPCFSVVPIWEPPANSAYRMRDTKQFFPMKGAKWFPRGCTNRSKQRHYFHGFSIGTDSFLDLYNPFFHWIWMIHLIYWSVDELSVWFTSTRGTNWFTWRRCQLKMDIPSIVVRTISRINFACTSISKNKLILFTLVLQMHYRRPLHFTPLIEMEFQYCFLRVCCCSHKNRCPTTLWKDCQLSYLMIVGFE